MLLSGAQDSSCVLSRGAVIFVFGRSVAVTTLTKYVVGSRGDGQPPPGKPMGSRTRGFTHHREPRGIAKTWGHPSVCDRLGYEGRGSPITGNLAGARKRGFNLGKKPVGVASSRDEPSRQTYEGREFAVKPFDEPPRTLIGEASTVNSHRGFYAGRHPVVPSAVNEAKLVARTNVILD